MRGLERIGDGAVGGWGFGFEVKSDGVGGKVGWGYEWLSNGRLVVAVGGDAVGRVCYFSFGYSGPED